MKELSPLSLDMESWTDVYQYICESKVNGQHKQAKELFRQLNAWHKMEFKEVWLRELFAYDGDDLTDDQQEQYQLLKIYFI